MDDHAAAPDGTLRVVFAPPAPPPRTPVRRPARVAQQLVLAHRIRQRIDDGVFENQSAAAAEYGLSRNRMSQVLALTFLAPDIQLEVLALEAIDGVEPPVTEKWLLESVVRLLDWPEQLAVWAARLT